jgi:dipeptidyl aminopeptidase/acylaminoacyl peptidase
VEDKQTVKVQFREYAPTAHILIIGREPYHPPNVQDRIISMLPDDPEHILLAASPGDIAHPQAVMVDVREGYPRVLMRSAGNVVKWLADSDGIIRLKATLQSHDDGGASLIYQVRDTEHGDWRPLQSSELDYGRRFVPLAFSKAEAGLLVLADNDDGRLALREMDTRSGAMGPALASDPRCDIEPVMRDEKLVGTSDPCQGEVETYFDPAWQKDQAVLQHALKTQMVEIIDRTPDGRYSLVKSLATPSAPPSYWYFDQSGEHKTLSHLGEGYEGIPADAVGVVRQVTIPARDGTPLPALLTMPHNAPPGPASFVVLPHGGPTAHDSVQFDWIVQFLVSRGYGVLQPQFRGSTGYGAAFQRAGYQQWGRLMQDDVTDATRWLISQKLADPRHVCIVGSSYGGYSALMGAAQHPDLYRCSVAIAPVTDLDRLLHDRDRGEFGDIHRARVAGGFGEVDIPSPIEAAGTMTVPVLLIHGRRDFTVPLSHTEAMAARLKQAGRAPKVVILDDSDHFFSFAGSRLKMLKAMEDFLGANLDGDPARRS